MVIGSLANRSPGCTVLVGLPPKVTGIDVPATTPARPVPPSPANAAWIVQVPPGWLGWGAPGPKVLSVALLIQKTQLAEPAARGRTYVR